MLKDDEELEARLPNMQLKDMGGNMKRPWNDQKIKIIFPKNGITKYTIYENAIPHTVKLIRILWQKIIDYILKTTGMTKRNPCGASKISSRRFLKQIHKMIII
jgi:hypothetical protein